jgi:pimeloyl-ACP methyl ester carboxylesterase
VIAALPLSGFTEKQFQGTEVRLNYAEGPANGPPLLLLHGLSRDWRSFSVLLPELSRRFRVLSIDLRGHGRSSRVLYGYRISQFARDISEFVRSEFSSSACIFGHSLGAMTGLMAAANPKCKIQALIVGDSMITPQNFRRSLYFPLFRQLHQLLLQFNSQSALASAMGKIAIPVPGLDEPVRIEDLPGNGPDVLMEWARCALLTDPDALAMTVDGTAFEDWEPRKILPQITCPTLLLQANPELDGMLLDEDVKLALDLLPEGRHVKFPLLGHALFMHQTKPVLEAILQFLMPTSQKHTSV